MYWCKRNLFFIGVGLVAFSACKPQVKQGGAAYFDLKTYFTGEVTKLTKQNPAVLKTVNYNNQPEQKTVHIKNWKQELELFTGSDINKPAWRESYKATVNKDSTVFTAIDTNLHTRYIAVILSAGKVKAIHITNFTTNLLYQTTDKLSYYPDSLYVIQKHQSVKILGTNNYQISGKLK